MPMIIACPRCSKQLQVPDGSDGKQVNCPGCKTLFLIGAQARQPVAAASAPSAPQAAPPAPPPAPPPAAAPPATSDTAETASTPSTCPACSASLLPGAISCMDCGFLLQAEPDDVSDMEGPPHLCPNQACGVANPPGEKHCQRCGTPLPTAQGTLLQDRYRIEKLLAMGGFGAVYLATDIKNKNREVAIKDMICADKEEFDIRLNFFRREAEILRSLSNVSIVPEVYDLIEHGQSAFLIMEFIRGQDLLKLMENNNDQPFPLEQVIEWGKSICDVLEHMHKQTPPIVHRDMKPDNLMLLDDKKSIKMIDFGTARDLGATRKERAAAKTRVYTEGYAPPEQIVGKPEPRSDLFALAGTMYHLVTGKAPEGFYTARELETQLADGSGAISADQRWFFELVRINLAEDVNDRYFTAREIRTDLEKRQVTREVPCGSCQHPNKVREPYCGKCGEAMTDPSAPCHHCGKANRMGSRFCIYCGNRLR